MKRYSVKKLTFGAYWSLFDRVSHYINFNLYRLEIWGWTDHVN